MLALILILCYIDNIKSIIVQIINKFGNCRNAFS